jgi:mannose-1-phosphate guanylyltransferase/mannose-6-phosphate isomerase
MCGGAGTRLWPASRAESPKQFLALTGEGPSTFQSAIRRLVGIANARRPIVVGGTRHLATIQAQLAAIGLDADIIVEPEPRDSAPAIAAAAVAIAERDADGIAVVVASDHHIPDAAAFRAAVEQAAVAAQDGAIVTLGVRPDAPSTAYGYVRSDAPSSAGVAPVAAFAEKPDAERARRYIEQGYLWNSGNFIFAARTLLDELDRLAPEIAEAARRALRESERSGDVRTLGPSFRAAPKISIDYAVMEKTRHAAVLPVDFAWSDLGAWDAVWAAAGKDAAGNVVSGAATLLETRDCLVRNNSRTTVATIGLTGIAVVVEDDAVLVCDLERSQGVKQVAGLVAGASARSAPAADAVLKDRARRFGHWLRTSALPVWWALGADHGRGGFHELLGLDGAVPDSPRRVRVQARQAYVYAEAGAMGWAGPWAPAADHGLACLRRRYRRDDGLFRTCVAADGAVLDDTAYLYDQAFALLAMAARQRAGGAPVGLAGEAEALHARILAEFGHPGGGFREAGDAPFQSNPHMHFLEACLAWAEAGGGAIWDATADAIVEMALDKFIDPGIGALREFFMADWTPAAGAPGRLVEPGHQFEWAWLLLRWARRRGEAKAELVARRLFAAGAAGVDAARGVAVDGLNDDLSVRNGRARLWPQTERLKAALSLSERPGPEAATYRDHAAAAAAALWRYLETPTPGLWRDKLEGDGRFVEEPAPASSFYHLMAAIRQLEATAAAL